MSEKADKTKRKTLQKKIEKYHKHTKAILPGNLKEAVRVPQNLDLNEWFAVHIVDFHKQIILLYGCIADFCTAQSCPVMGAGVKFEYLWRDPDDNNKKPVKMTAIEYFDSLTNWLDKVLDDETKFPKTDGTFPADFQTLTKTIFKRFFRTFAHLYYSHFLELCKLGLEAHINTCFKHFYCFIREFNLIEEQEMQPLKHLIKNLAE